MKKVNVNFLEIIKGGAYSLISKTLGVILNYALITYLTLKISKEAVGYYNISFVILSLSATIFSLGLNFSSTRIVGENIQDKANLVSIYSTSIKLIGLLSFIGGLILFFSSSYIATYFFRNLEYNKILKLVSVSIPFFVISIFNIEFLRGLKKVHISESIRNLVIPLAIFMFIFFVQDSFKLILLLVIGSIMSFIISSLFIFKSLGKIVVKENVEFGYIMGVSIPLLFVGIFAFLLSESAMFFLEYFYSTKTTGSYVIIYKISLLSSIFYTVLYSIIGPKISEHYWKNNLDELKKTIRFSNIILLSSSLIVLLLSLVFLDYLLTFFKLEFNLKDSLKIMIFGQFLYAITGIPGIYLMVTNHQKQFRNAYALSAFLNVILCIILIPSHGILGASIAISVSYIVLNLICYYFFFKYYKNE